MHPSPAVSVSDRFFKQLEQMNRATRREVERATGLTGSQAASALETLSRRGWIQRRDERRRVPSGRLQDVWEPIPGPLPGLTRTPGANHNISIVARALASRSRLELSWAGLPV